MRRRVNKGLVIGLVLVLAFSFIVIIPTNVSAAGPWFVDTTGNNAWDGLFPVWGGAGVDTNGDGMEDGPWQTITFAVNNARVMAGDTINVAAGTYVERFTISKSLNLIGAGRITTIIDGNGGGDVVTITADSVMMKKFTVKKSSWPTSCIYLKGTAADKITGCTIANVECEINGYGFNLYYADDNTIGTNTEVVKCRTSRRSSINLLNSNGNDFTNIEISQITNNVALWRNHAVLLEDSSSNIFDDVTITENYDWIWVSPGIKGYFYYDGFHLKGNCDQNEIKNSEIDETANAIYFEGTATKICNQNKIETNEIYMNRWNGIKFEYANTNYIQTNNVLYNNYRNGIFLENSDSNIIKENLIRDSGVLDYYDGIYLSTSDSNTIEKNGIYNTASGNQQYGIRIVNSIDNMIQYNDDYYGTNYGIYSNKVDGILIDNCVASTDSVRNEMISNDIFDNPNNGIHIKNSDRHRIHGNNMYVSSGSQKNGIYLESSKTITATSNTMSNMGIMITGYVVDQWDTHVIDTANTVNTYPVQYLKNQLSGTVSTSAGEVILGDCQNIVIENQLNLNQGSVGILLGFSDYCIIEENTCNLNNFYGICLYTDSDYNRLCENTCNSNTEVGLNLHNNNNNNIIYYNTVNSNIKDGIFLDNGNGIGHINNMIRNNNVKINSDNGIHLKNSNENILENNEIDSNTNYGVKVEDSTDNLIFHNNFKNNNGGGTQAYDDNNNNWDNGYPKGGNYWDDFDESTEGAYDDYRGSSQGNRYDDANFNYIGDGIVDFGSGTTGTNPYSIAGPGGMQDIYPLILPVLNDRVQRPPIRISGNSDLNSANRADLGIISGSGNQGDPYVIEGWDINGNGYGYCFFMELTTLHVEIQNCKMHQASGQVSSEPNYWDPQYPDAGIIFRKVQNQFGVNNEITSLDWNIGDPYALSMGFIVTKPSVIESNAWDGILLHGINPYQRTSDVKISECIISDNGQAGVFLWEADDIEIYDNLINFNYLGIYCAWQGAWSTITYNNIEHNTYYGIMMWAMCSDYDQIHYNNFISNNNGGTQAGDYGGAQNNWDYNYWDDYTGPDNNGDGYGDIPYIIDGSIARDNYPLMNPVP